MRGLSQGAALTLAALMLSCAAVAAEPPSEIKPVYQGKAPPSTRMVSPCGVKRHVQITLALPNDYKDKLVSGRGPGTVGVCVRLGYGSTYQVLSWLENGAVQAAVMPAFAVRVMRADDPERFDREYYTLRTHLVKSIPLLERRIRLFDGDYQEVPEPEQKLVDFFTSLRESPAERSIWLRSHLSPAVPYLIHRARSWADYVELSGDARNEFFRLLTQSIRFGKRMEVDPTVNAQKSLHLVDDPVVFGSADAKPVSNRLMPPDEPAFQDDQVIVRKQVFLASPELRDLVTSTPPREIKDAPEVIALFAASTDDEQALGEHIRNFRESNYRRLQFGSVAQRHFRFTIPELWWLLRHADPRAADDGMALVLTGGGVKAAYQTRLIDHLYEKGRLFNKGTESIDPQIAQRVDYVIGTSGGALLGVFVAAINKKFEEERVKDVHNNLTSILWKEPGIGLSSGDVFPFLDMMRYATMIVALLVVWLVAAAVLSLFRTQYRQITRFDHSDESFFDRRARAFKESWPWILLLVTAPIIIVKVATVNRVEHVPTETGLYYAIMALVAFYSDVRLHPLKPFRWLRSRLTWRTAILFTAGATAIVLALVRPAWLNAISPYEDRGLLFVNLCCAGFVVLVLATHCFFFDQKEYFRAETRRPIFHALGVLLGIVLLSYLGVSLAMWLEATSLLEMHGGFWKYFLLLTALLTGLFMWLARSRAGGNGLTWPQQTAAYMFSEYRSRALFGSERRYMRFMTMTIAAWVWWNALAAPALYGNRNAREYLESAFMRYTELALPDVKKLIDTQRARREADRLADASKGQDENDYGVEFPLSVPFVITATSLEKGQERYFLFMSGDSDEQIDDQLDDEAWFEVVRDARWVVVRKPVDSELRHAAFASGSPFPVFSAHDVKLRALRNAERLIDGGFAHNKPLEAASALGARKVLVLNSSPIESAGAGSCTVVTLNLGELACNLPKLVPYLWERSQVEDLLSTRSMVVASIYPTAARGTWPSLTDFRGETVLQLVTDAKDDIEQRVGVIESWGEPQMGLEDDTLLYYDRDQVMYELLNTTS
jgi:predicted acylesterase/phospholipase RssA